MTKLTSSQMLLPLFCPIAAFGEFERHAGVIAPGDDVTCDKHGAQAVPIKTPLITSFQPNPIFKEKFGQGKSLEF